MRCGCRAILTNCCTTITQDIKLSVFAYKFHCTKIDGIIHRLRFTPSFWQVFIRRRANVDTFIVKKVLNNNVLIAMDHDDEEVVLIGKGIGFNTKKDASIREDSVEKLFVLRNEKEQEYYKNLLPHIDEKVLSTLIDSIEMIRSKSNVKLNERVHVALTDHMVFAINRLFKGMTIRNPFLTEKIEHYIFDYDFAVEVVYFFD